MQDGNPKVREARVQFDSRKTYTQGIVGGAIIGAALGAAIGALRGGGQGAVRGALIGGAAGGLTGGVVADQKVNERRGYQVKDQALDTAIQNASSTRKAAVQFNRTLASQIRTERRNSATVVGTLADARDVLATLKKEKQRQMDVLADASSRGVSPGDRAVLRREIQGLEAERQELTRNIDRLTPGTIQIGSRTGR